VAGNLSFMGSFMPLLLAGGLAFVVLGLRTRPAAWWFVGAYLAAAVATAFLIGKIGSDVNYLPELSAGLALAAGSLVGRYPSRPGVRSALLLALAVKVAIMVQASQFTYARFQAGVIENREGLARLEEVVDDSNGPVLADEYAGLLPLEGRGIYLQPFEMTQLQRDERWDQRPLVASVERREFPVILIWEPPYAAGVYRERWTRQMLEAIDEDYRPIHKYAGTVVYLPRQDKDVP
jgi:hypothetical protein